MLARRSLRVLELDLAIGRFVMRNAGFVSGLITGALAGAAIAMLVTPLGPPGTREALRALADASRRTVT